MKAAHKYVVGREVEKQESLIELPETVSLGTVIKCNVESVGASCPPEIKRAKMVMFDKRNAQSHEGIWFVSFENILAAE